MRKLSSLLICFVCCFALAACAGTSKTVKPRVVHPTVTKVAPKKSHFKKRAVKKAKVIRKVNINTASVKTLRKVKHIGRIRAKRIVQYRTKHGKFQSVNDLTKVKGISKKTLMKLKLYLTV